MPKLTPWFPPEVKPVHVGVYKRKFSFGVRYALWNGVHWCGYSKSAFDAMWNIPAKSWYQTEPWRGLASNPAIKGD